MNGNRIQVFNISYDDQCCLCKHVRVSDLFGDPMCNNTIDTHILYPDINGNNKCPFIELEEEE